MEQASIQADKPALTLHRKFPVAPEKVWRAWTEPQALNTILLRPEGKGTDMEFRHEQFFDEAARDGHLRGWSGTFVKLEAFLKGETKS